MAINFEIRPSRPRIGLSLEILSKLALALAQEGLGSAPRPSVLDQKNTWAHWQLILEAGSARRGRPGAEYSFGPKVFFGLDQKNRFTCDHLQYY